MILDFLEASDLSVRYFFEPFLLSKSYLDKRFFWLPKAHPSGFASRKVRSRHLRCLRGGSSILGRLGGRSEFLLRMVHLCLSLDTVDDMVEPSVPSALMCVRELRLRELCLNMELPRIMIWENAMQSHTCVGCPTPKVRRPRGPRRRARGGLFATAQTLGQYRMQRAPNKQYAQRPLEAVAEQAQDSAPHCDHTLKQKAHAVTGFCFSCGSGNCEDYQDAFHKLLTRLSAARRPSLQSIQSLRDKTTNADVYPSACTETKCRS